MDKVGVGTNVQPICFVPLGVGGCSKKAFYFHYVFLEAVIQQELQNISERKSKNCIRSKLETCVSDPVCQHEDSA